MIVRQLILGLVVCGLLVTATQTANAAPVDADPDTEVARRHFEIGRGYYEVGDYARALKEFEEASLSKPGPAFDYNIARCYDRLENWEKAIAAYQRFADTSHDEAAVASARERIAVLEERVRVIEANRKQAGQDKFNPPATPTIPASPSTPPSSVADPAVTIAPSSSTARHKTYVAPAVLAGAAVALLAVGAGLLGSVVPEYNRLQNQCATGMCPTSDWQGFQTRERAGLGLVIAGGAVAVADVVLWVITARHVKRDSQRAFLVPSVDVRGGAGLIAGGRF